MYLLFSWFFFISSSDLIWCQKPGSCYPINSMTYRQCIISSCTRIFFRIIQVNMHTVHSSSKLVRMPLKQVPTDHRCKKAFHRFFWIFLWSKIFKKTFWGNTEHKDCLRLERNPNFTFLLCSWGTLSLFSYQRKAGGFHQFPFWIHSCRGLQRHPDCQKSYCSLCHRKILKVGFFSRDSTDCLCSKN